MGGRGDGFIQTKLLSSLFSLSECTRLVSRGASLKSTTPSIYLFSSFISQCGRSREYKLIQHTHRAECVRWDTIISHAERMGRRGERGRQRERERERERRVHTAEGKALSCVLPFEGVVSYCAPVWLLSRQSYDGCEQIMIYNQSSNLVWRYLNGVIHSVLFPPVPSGTSMGDADIG